MSEIAALIRWLRLITLPAIRYLYVYALAKAQLSACGVKITEALRDEKNLR
jgi:hypothetical protein